MTDFKVSFSANAILHCSLEEIWHLSDKRQVTINFEDGSVLATGRSIIYSWFFWEFHRKIEGVTLLKSHLVPQKKMTANTHPEFLEFIIWEVYNQCSDHTEVATLRKIAYDITNDIFNHLTVNLESYVTSSCILDYLEIMEDETINELIENTPPNPTALIETKGEIKEYLKKPDIYTSNALKAICEADLVNWDQLLQAIAYRGYTTDMDNYFFPNPIMNGYGHGITSFHDSLLESTSSTKSLIAQDDALKQTEFFNKRMQLISPVIKSLIKGDCGSTTYNRIMLTGNVGKVKGNFKSLVGKRYLKEDGSLGVINKDSKHLIGQRLKIRSVMNCRYRHTGNICATCYGNLALNVPEGCNLGYFSAVAFCEIISQMVLSTKHLDNAAGVDMIYIEPMLRQIFNVRAKEQDIILKEIFRMPNKLVTLLISPVYNGDKIQLSHLEDLELIDIITNHTVMRKSNIKSFTVTVEDIDTGIPIIAPTTLTIGNGVDGAYLSKEMLEYIKVNNWTVTDKGDYEFDLGEFPKDSPIFTLPKKHMNMLEFKNLVSKFMESAGTSKHRSGERLTEFNNVENKVEQALIRFLEVVNEKVTVNITHLELFILICMGRNPSKSDARLPKYDEEFSFMPASNAFNLRSMGAVMPFKDQYPWLTRIESYSGEGKIASPFDGIMAPEIFND